MIEPLGGTGQTLTGQSYDPPRPHYKFEEINVTLLVKFSGIGVALSWPHAANLWVYSLGIKTLHKVARAIS